MASRRSSSSVPSEGEIIESGSETKATTSQTPLNGTSVDRPTRARNTSTSLTRSPRRRSRTVSRSRSRSRSPYRDYRGYKRRRDDDYDSDFGLRSYDYDDRRSGRTPPRRSGPRYGDRGYSARQARSYYDYDREDNQHADLRYGDEYDRRREKKRPRTRSRSPYREVRKRKQYSGDEWGSQGPRRADSAASQSQSQKNRRSSTEQSVSERGKPPAVARDSGQNAETQVNQVQAAPAASAPDTGDRYVVSS